MNGCTVTVCTSAWPRRRERSEAILPSAHSTVRRETILDEQQLALQPEYPTHFASAVAAREGAVYPEGRSADQSRDGSE